MGQKYCCHLSTSSSDSDHPNPISGDAQRLEEEVVTGRRLTLAAPAPVFFHNIDVVAQTIKKILAHVLEKGGPCIGAKNFWSVVPAEVPTMRLLPASTLANALLQGGDVINTCGALDAITDIAALPNQDNLVVFVSHRWWSSHEGMPDTPDFKKLHAINDIVPAICKMCGVSKERVHFWFDFACVDHDIPDKRERDLMAVPYYAMAADVFLMVRSGDKDCFQEPPVYYDKIVEDRLPYRGPMHKHPQHYDNRIWIAIERYAAASPIAQQVIDFKDRKFLQIELGPDFGLACGLEDSFKQIHEELYRSIGWSLPPQDNLTCASDVDILEPVLLGISSPGGMPRIVSAARFGFARAVHLFVAEGDDVNARVDRSVNAGALKGCAALHIAASQHDFDVIRALLECGNANANIVDSMGSTPLHRLIGAASFIEFYKTDGGRKFSQCASVLLEYRARVDVIDSLGRTPLKMANDIGNKDLLGLFESKGLPAIDFPTFSRLGTSRTQSGRMWCFRDYPGPRPNSEIMLMFHSCFFDKDMLFGTFAQELRSRSKMRVICVDLPFAGGTSEYGGPLNLPAVAADFLDVIDSQAWSPCHLAGVSVGGDICLHLLKARPESIHSVTLMAFASAAPNPPDKQKAFAEFIAACRRKDGNEFYLKKLNEPGLLGKYFLSAPEHAEARKRLFESVGRMDVGRASGLFEMWNRRDYTPDFQSINCPMLLIAGKQDDWFIQNSIEAKENCTVAQLEFLDLVGHQIPLEGSARTLDLMQSFLDRHAYLKDSQRNKTTIETPDVAAATEELEMVKRSLTAQDLQAASKSEPILVDLDADDQAVFSEGDLFDDLARLRQVELHLRKWGDYEARIEALMAQCLASPLALEIGYLKAEHKALDFVLRKRLKRPSLIDASTERFQNWSAVLEDRL